MNGGVGLVFFIGWLDFHPFSSIFIHFHPFSSIFIHFHPFPPISTHFHPFQPISIRFLPLSVASTITLLLFLLNIPFKDILFHFIYFSDSFFIFFFEFQALKGDFIREHVGGREGGREEGGEWASAQSTLTDPTRSPTSRNPLDGWRFVEL